MTFSAITPSRSAHYDGEVGITDAGQRVSPGSPGYSSSPIRSSPLSNPPIVPAHHASLPHPSRSAGHRAQPTPIPHTKSARRTSFRSPPTSMTPSRPLIHPHSPTSPTVAISPHSPPLARSHPLLGSFSLSLLHSRMSHAHKPHSVTPSPTTGFALHIGAVGKGRSCPRELRCPAHEVVPFAATYYDLEDGGRKSQTPWVGSVDLEEHYYTRYTSDTMPLTSPKNQGGTGNLDPQHATPPPAYPGYRVAPVGQIQTLIKTPDSAVKVFLVPYDLRSLRPGGRLLARERTFVSSASTSPDSHDRGGSSPSSIRSSTSPRERLRCSIQLQFICIPRSQPIKPTRDSSTTRRSRHRQEPHSCAVEEGMDGPGQVQPCNDYYLARTIKVIFTSTPLGTSEVERTERTDEVVLPTEDVSEGLKRGRVPSFSSPAFSVGSPRTNATVVKDDWDVVCRKWHARREVEAVTFEAEPLVQDVPSRNSSPPVSLLSSQVLSPPTRDAQLPVDTSSSPMPVLAPLPLLPTGSSALVSKTIVRTASPQPPSVRTPPLGRYLPRQKLRRGSGSLDERELSERLRSMRTSHEP